MGWVCKTGELPILYSFFVILNVFAYLLLGKVSVCVCVRSRSRTKHDISYDLVTPRNKFPLKKDRQKTVRILWVTYFFVERLHE